MTGEPSTRDEDGLFEFPPPSRPIALARAFTVTNAIILAVGLIFSALILKIVLRVQRDEVAVRFAREADAAQHGIDRLFRQAEDTVGAMAETIPLVLQIPPAKFLDWANGYADWVLSSRPEQFNFYFAFNAEQSKRMFARDGMVYVVAKDPALYDRPEMDSPATFRRLTFTDPVYQTDPAEVWYQGAAQSHAIHHSRLYYDYTYMKRVVFSITKAFRDPKTGAVLGVAGMDVTVGTFSRLLSSFVIGETGGVFVLDALDRPIAAFMGADNPMLGFRYVAEHQTRPDFLEVLTEAPRFERKPGLQTIEGRDGKTYVVKVLPLEKRPYSVVIYQARNETYWPVFWTFGLILLLGTVFFAISLYFRKKLAAFVVGNIDRILANIEANRLVLQPGDSDSRFYPLEPSGPLEIARIARQLNSLYERLQLSFREVQGERDRAEEATKTKSRFLSIMSHEIRTPLNAMLGLTDVLLQSRLDSEQAKNLRIIRRSGHSLLRILNDILDFSRLEAGKLEIEVHEFGLFELLYDVEGLLRFQAEQKGLHLRIAAPPTDFVLAGDSVRIRQTLLNLAGNAVKFTAQGRVEIRVHAPVGSEPRPDEPAPFRFEVVDTGPGIGAEQQAKIFSEFSQADASIPRRFGGTGLGLAISRQIVELLGGKLEVRSVPGEGSTFEFTLPLVVRARKTAFYEDFAHTAPLPELRAPAAANVGAAPPYSLLVVDDDDDNHRLIDAYLRNRPEIRTVHARSGSEAVALAEKGDYSLVLMDLQMPDMDGLKATQEIRRRQRDGAAAPCPIVMLSANTFPEDREKSLEAGAVEHVGKPISMAEFHALLAKYPPAEPNA